MAYLVPGDLSPLTDASLEQLQIVIDDLEAAAVFAATCLANPERLSAAQTGAVKAMLRTAAMRWVDRVRSTDRMLVAGPFSAGPVPGASETRRTLWWPSEIEQLQAICSGQDQSRGRAVMGWLV